MYEFHFCPFYQYKILFCTLTFLLLNILYEYIIAYLLYLCNIFNKNNKDIKLYVIILIVIVKRGVHMQDINLQDVETAMNKYGDIVLTKNDKNNCFKYGTI